MPDIIQFFHPGGQYQIHNHSSRYCWNNRYKDGMYFWNNGDHRRKFLRSKGDYVNSAKNLVKDDDLLFWGEWEPCSQFQMLENPNNNSLLPYHIHSPVFCLVKQGAENTDPIVFGSDFFYSVCNQRGKLLNLSKGTIILFGTNFLNPKSSKPCFVLDTVFIVGKSTPYTIKGKISGLNQKPGDILYDITLSKLGNMSLNLYTGEKYPNNKNYYSFVPVKQYSLHSEIGFERVKFYHSANEDSTQLDGLSQKTQGWSYIKKKITLMECQLFYDSLVNKIHTQGFDLGVRFDLPSAPDKNMCCCNKHLDKQKKNSKINQSGGCPPGKSC